METKEQDRTLSIRLMGPGLMIGARVLESDEVTA